MGKIVPHDDEATVKPPITLPAEKAAAAVITNGKQGARFLACLPFVLIQEAPVPDDWSNLKNFSDDAHDPGGATMNGITQTEYDVYRKHKGLPVHSVKLITRDEAYDIYNKSYWLPYSDLLPNGLDLCFFDTSVNEGPHAAVKILQLAIGINDDGNWGPQTALAVRGISNPVLVINAFTAQRKIAYRKLRGYQYFGTDWERRDAEIGAEALKMVSPK